jgi:hypothetical protein
MAEVRKSKAITVPLMAEIRKSKDTTLRYMLVILFVVGY